MPDNVKATNGDVQEFSSAGLCIGIVRTDGHVSGQEILCRDDPEHRRDGVCFWNIVWTRESKPGHEEQVGGGTDE